MYTLPDPDGFVYGWSSPSQLVPILVGMDHLQKIGLVLNFSDGFALHGAEPEAEPYCLHKNPKGHFMIDLVYYLCGVISDAENIDTFAATMDGASPQSSGQGSWSWLELGPMELMAVSHAQVSDSQHAAPSHGFQFLCDRRKQLSSTTRAEKSQVKTVTFETASHGSQEQVRGSSKEPFVASRTRPSSTGRSSRSSQPINMALQRLSRAQDQWRQRFGHLVGLCNMWPEDELHSSTRYSSEVYDPECPGGHHQCPEDAEGALDRGPKAQCQHGEDLHQAGGIFNGDRGAQGQVDPDGGSSPKPKSSPPERGPESAVNGDRRRNCPAERDCWRTSSSVSHVSARLRGGSDPIPEGTHASKQSLKPDDGAIAMHDGGRLVETDTKMVSLPCDQQHGNSSFALMNAQDNNEPEDASLAEDFELLHFVESKMIGSSSKNHQKQSKKGFATTKILKNKIKSLLHRPLLIQCRHPNIWNVLVKKGILRLVALQSFVAYL